MSNTQTQLERANELATRAKRDPTGVADHLSEAVELVRTNIETPESPALGAETREAAAKAIERVSYAMPDRVVDHLPSFEPLLIEQQRQLIERSRTESTTTYRTSVREAQSSLLRAAHESVRFASRLPVDWIADLPSVFALGTAETALIEQFLDLYDSCVVQSEVAVAIDLDGLIEILDHPDPTITEKVITVFESIAQTDAEPVLPVIEHIDQSLQRHGPSVSASVLDLLAVIGQEKPLALRPLRERVESQLDSSNWTIRARAIAVLLQLPGVTPEKYSEHWAALERTLERGTPKENRDLIEPLRLLPASGLESVPVAPLVDALGAEEYLTSIVASQSLMPVVMHCPQRVTGSVNRIVTFLQSSEATHTPPLLMVLAGLTNRAPESVAPHASSIAAQVQGESPLELRHKRRQEALLEHSRNASSFTPRSQLQYRALRQRKGQESVLSRSDMSIDKDTFAPYIAINILRELVSHAPTELVASLPEITQAMRYAHTPLRKATVGLLDELVPEYADAVYPHLPPVLEYLTDSEPTTTDADVRIAALGLLFTTVFRMSTKIGDRARDISRFFELIELEPVGDDEQRRRERILSLMILSVVFRNYCITTDALERVRTDPETDSDVRELAGRDHVRSEIELRQSDVQQLVDYGVEESPREKALVLRSLMYISLVNERLVVPHLPRAVEWSLPTSDERGDTADQYARTAGSANVSARTDQKHLEPPVSEGGDLFSGSPNAVRAKASSLCSIVGGRAPEALLPNVETVVYLANHQDESVAEDAIVALEELVSQVRVSAVSERVVDPMLNQLLHSDPTVRERAAHVLSLLAGRQTAAIASALDIVVAALRESTSTAARLFLARTIAVVAETQPESIPPRDTHLLEAIHAANVPTVRHSDLPYVHGEGANQLTDDVDHNLRIAREHLRDSFSHALAVEELESEWSRSVLEEFRPRVT